MRNQILRSWYEALTHSLTHSLPALMRLRVYIVINIRHSTVSIPWSTSRALLCPKRTLQMAVPQHKNDYSLIGKHTEDLRRCLNTSLVNAGSLWNFVPHSERRTYIEGVIHIRWSLQLFITLFTEHKVVCFPFYSTFSMHCLVFCFVYKTDIAQKIE
jgi:hypothetical protein